MVKPAVCCVCLGVAVTVSEYLFAQDAAHFWLSVDAKQSAGPGTPPPIELDQGENKTIHIWGRPMPGRKLRSFSLNLVASAPGVDFLDGTFEVHNDSIGRSALRFQFVHDSSAEDPGNIIDNAELFSETDGMEQADAVNGLLGFGLVGFMPQPPLTILGIGGECSRLDANCVIASDGFPAWRIATVELEAVAAGEIELFLQVGEDGIRHEYLPGDYDRDSAVNEGDYNIWRATFGAAEGDSGELLADGNRDGTVDAADYVTWRENVGAIPVLEGSALSFVQFGTNPGGGQEPIYNAGYLADREITLPADDFDAVIVVSGPPVGRFVSLPYHDAGAAVVPEPSCQGLILVAVISLGFIQLRTRSRDVNRAERFSIVEAIRG